MMDFLMGEIIDAYNLFRFTITGKSVKTYNEKGLLIRLQEIMDGCNRIETPAEWERVGTEIKNAIILLTACDVNLITAQTKDENVMDAYEELLDINLISKIDPDLYSQEPRGLNNGCPAIDDNGFLKVVISQDDTVTAILSLYEAVDKDKSLSKIGLGTLEREDVTSRVNALFASNTSDAEWEALAAQIVDDIGYLVAFEGSEEGPDYREMFERRERLLELKLFNYVKNDDTTKDSDTVKLHTSRGKTRLKDMMDKATPTPDTQVPSDKIISKAPKLVDVAIDSITKSPNVVIIGSGTSKDYKDQEYYQGYTFRLGDHVESKYPKMDDFGGIVVARNRVVTTEMYSIYVFDGETATCTQHELTYNGEHDIKRHAIPKDFKYDVGDKCLDLRNGEMVSVLLQTQFLFYPNEYRVLELNRKMTDRYELQEFYLGKVESENLMHTYKNK